MKSIMNFVMLNVGGLCCKGYDLISNKIDGTTFYQIRKYYIYPNGKFAYVFHNGEYFFHYVDNILSKCYRHSKKSAEYMFSCYFCENNNNEKITILNSLIDGRHICLNCFEKRGSKNKIIKKEKTIKRQEQLSFW